MSDEHGSQDSSLIVTPGGGAHRSSLIVHRSFPRSPIPQPNTQPNDERRRFNDLPLAPPLLNETSHVAPHPSPSRPLVADHPHAGPRAGRDDGGRQRDLLRAARAVAVSASGAARRGVGVDV